MAEIPTDCDRGTKCQPHGYNVCWHGFKLHIDTADCGVPVSALLSSSSMHDSRAAIPLSLIGAASVTNLYYVTDAANCCSELDEHCRSLGHIPLIDHTPRGGEREDSSRPTLFVTTSAPSQNAAIPDSRTNLVAGPCESKAAPR